MNLWRLEYLRLRRTWRGPGLTVIFLFFGVLGPISARYLEQILTSFGTDDVQITFPPPVPADGMVQYLGNAQQVGLLAVIAVAAGALSIDGTADIAIFLRTRVTSTARLVLTRYAVYAAVAALAWSAGALVAWYETWALIGGLPADRVLLGTALGGLYFAYVVAAVALASGMTRGSVGTMFLAFAIVLLPQITLGLVGGIGDWLPGHLAGAIAGLNDGSADPADYLRATLTTLVAVALALTVSVRLLDHREV